MGKMIYFFLGFVAGLYVEQKYGGPNVENCIQSIKKTLNECEKK